MLKAEVTEMKKLLYILIITMFFVFSLSGCDKASDKNAELLLKSYEYEKSGEPLKPNVTLDEDNKFSFCYSFLSSYLPVGTYEIENGNLILIPDDDLNNQYIFEIEDETLIFNAEKSSELPDFAGVPNGAVFK